MKSWQGLVAALGENVDRLKLRPPATEAEIAGAETLFERPLPADYRTWLAIADGQDGDGLSILPSGGHFFPLARVIETWLTNGRFVVPEWDSSPVKDDELVRPFVFHRTRIPIGGDDLSLAEPVIDLWPGPRGTSGQLLSLISECDFAVFAKSLDDFFTRTAILIITQKIRIEGDMFVRTDSGWLDLLERR